MNSEHEDDLNRILNDKRDQKIKELFQSIMCEQPINDELTQLIIKKLHLPWDSTKLFTHVNLAETNDQQTSTLSISSIHPYPPLNQIGTVNDHDRPYADYGHLDRQIIAQECGFNLCETSTSFISGLMSLCTKSFAIIVCTDVSKDVVIQKIKDDFGIENIQYICIGEEMNEFNHQQYLCIQIILKEIMYRIRSFLDTITQTSCNYQVTQNDCAWNEYIKQGGHYIEFNEFKSTIIHKLKQWPASPSSASVLTLPVSTTTLHNQQSLLPRAVRTMTIEAQIEEKHQHQIEIVKQIYKLAETNINMAMKLIRREIIDITVECDRWYLKLLNYVQLRAQRDADQRGDIKKEFIWPHSFPDCTPKLRDAMNEWIGCHFSCTEYTKCLVLIGPMNTGKTSFALSLPGHVNYFQDEWNLDAWNDYARYSVYDGIPWDDFEKFHFPKKQDLLTRKTRQIYTTDRNGLTGKHIIVRQPAIVLLNPEDVGSLISIPNTGTEKNVTGYWKKRTFVYRMGSDEYFYKRQSIVKTNADDSQITNNSSLSTIK